LNFAVILHGFSDAIRAALCGAGGFCWRGVTRGLVDAGAAAGQVVAACGPEPIKPAAVLGPVKAKP
jgi:hypothetical protein